MYFHIFKEVYKIGPRLLCIINKKSYVPELSISVPIKAGVEGLIFPALLRLTKSA